MSLLLLVRKRAPLPRPPSTPNPSPLRACLKALAWVVLITYTVIRTAQILLA